MNAPAALSSSIDIDWILQEPVLVRWKDQSDASSRELWLGQSLEKPAPVTLWVGARAAARSWIVMLQMTITTHFSGRVKSSDVFLFVPPHCCGFDANENTVVNPSPALDTFLRNLPSSSSAGYTRIPFHQGPQAHLEVLFEQRSPGARPYDGTALHLLMLLHSLSEAPQFDIYLSKTRAVRRALNRLRHELPPGLRPVNIDLLKAYEGHGGAWGIWDQYSPLFQTTGVRTDNEERSALCPPPYSTSRQQHQEEDVTPDASILAQSDSRKRPHTPEEDRSAKRFQIGQEEVLGSPTEVNTPSTTQDSPLKRISPFDDGEPLPTYTKSGSSVAGQDSNIKPTIFTRSTLPKALEAELAHLITTSIKAQIPSVAREISAQHIRTDLACLATTHIDAFVQGTLPKLATHALECHLSELQNEWDYAATELRETKDELKTELQCDHDQLLRDFRDETTACFTEHEDKADKFKTNALMDIEDKLMHLDAAIDLHNLAPLQRSGVEDNASAALIAMVSELRKERRERNSTRDAVTMFQRDHEHNFTLQQRVRVLRSLSRWNNAEVFLSVHSENRRALMDSWIHEMDV